ncbi:DUF58 domain-containing protein [Sulfuriroseicoccus oceanibius]|uniref:DUF58 domain-containing protein n=1 Tax=Sulfuriroseicoccus oceanibius TaxID=2707525 RepID=A0A6B3LB90_9BACT|nr:DUF58 domain-containing protein [Sulfuriroseicoccus oceanibius]QQL45535.1 DUF58 domain-containing protein [Sulfuriroseicoccus oceanibius]
MTKTTDKQQRREGWLYRRMATGYERGAQTRQHVMLRVTALGWWTLVFMMAFGFFGLDANRALAYMLFTWFFGMFWAGFLSSFRLSQRLEVERVLPGVAAAGGAVNYRVVVRNRGKRPLFGVRLVDLAPPMAPEGDEFFTVEEPGEAERNAFDRFFRYYRWTWLADRRHVREDIWSKPFDIGVGETRELEMRFVALRRGRAEFRKLRLTRPSAFGLFRAWSKLDAGSGSVVVLPKRLNGEPQMIGRGSRQQMGGEVSQAMVGLSDEFHSLRDYMHGDSFHHIHWKSWARTGKPIVREYENVFYPRYGLVIDSQLPAFPKGSAHRLTAAFENVMALAATLASDMDARETFLDVLVAGEKAIQVESGPGRASTRHVLEVLAGLHLEGGDHGAEGVRTLVQRYAPAMTGCWVLLLDWGGWRKGLVEDLMVRGVEVRVLVVRSEGVDFTEAPDPNDLAVRVVDQDTDLDRVLSGWPDRPQRVLAGSVSDSAKPGA